jgi:XTP/dITP diphosphohydrolase
MTLVFATHNPNKFREVQALLPAYIKLKSLDDIGCTEDIPETAATIEGNATLKAKYVRDHYGFDCFADDTGLEVPSLNNEPGVLSARYAGPGATSEANMKKLLAGLSGKANRKARFKTVIALSVNENTILFTGTCEGKITESPRGEKGFGYDPVFQPEGFQKTFAEMTPLQKGEIGHRGKAMRLLIDYLSERKVL